MDKQTASAEYEAASLALREHEKKHYPIKAEYDRSYAELERLSRAVAQAWRRMTDAAA